MGDASSGGSRSVLGARCGAARITPRVGSDSDDMTKRVP